MSKDKSKPWHDWRNDGRELAIVVIGVLIALLAQEMAQRWEWQQKIAAADDAMKREMFWDNGPEMIERISIQPCINAQLDAIRAAVEANRPRAEIVGLVDRLHVPYVSYDTVAYRDASASDVPTHMSRARENAWTQAYAMMPTVDATDTQETIDAARITALKRSGGALSDAEQIALLQAVEQVRADGARIMSGINWTMLVMPQLHGTFDKVRLDQGLRVARQDYGSCIRPVPADWPATHLPPLPKGIAPGLLSTAPPPWQSS